MVDFMVEANVLHPLLLKDAKEGYNMTVGYKHVSPYQSETVENLAVVLDHWVKQVYPFELGVFFSEICTHLASKGMVKNPDVGSVHLQVHFIECYVNISGSDYIDE